MKLSCWSETTTVVIIIIIAIIITVTSAFTITSLMWHHVCWSSVQRSNHFNVCPSICPYNNVSFFNRNWNVNFKFWSCVSLFMNVNCTCFNFFFSFLIEVIFVFFLLILRVSATTIYTINNTPNTICMYLQLIMVN